MEYANFQKIMNEKRNAHLFYNSMFIGCMESKEINRKLLILDTFTEFIRIKFISNILGFN